MSGVLVRSVQSGQQALTNGDGEYYFVEGTPFAGELSTYTVEIISDGTAYTAGDPALLGNTRTQDFTAGELVYSLFSGYGVDPLADWILVNRSGVASIDVVTGDSEHPDAFLQLTRGSGSDYTRYDPFDGSYFGHGLNRFRFDYSFPNGSYVQVRFVTESGRLLSVVYNTRESTRPHYIYMGDGVEGGGWLSFDRDIQADFEAIYPGEVISHYHSIFLVGNDASIDDMRLSESL